VTGRVWKSAGRRRPGRVSWWYALFPLLLLADGWSMAVPRLHLGVAGAIFPCMEVVGLVASVRAARSPGLTPAQRRPWPFIAASFVLLLLFGGTVGRAMLNGQYHPSVPVVVGLVCRALLAPVLLTGLLLFATEPLTRRARLRLALDVVTVLGGGLMALWYFLISPALEVGLSAGPLLVATALMPLTDLVLIVGVGTVMLRGGSPVARRPVALLLLGTVGYLVADAVITYQTAFGPGAGTSFVLEAAVITPLFLMVAAAAEQVRIAARPLSASQSTRPLRKNPALPYLALTVGYGLLVAAALRTGLFPWGGLVAGALVMTSAVAGRQLVVLRENHDMVVTDALTGLPNRIRMRDALTRAAERTRRSGRSVGVLLIDLDGFKEINDTLGHDAGDQVLVAFAGILRSHVRDTDTPARLGGDEFAVVLDGVDGTGDAAAVADKIITALHPPVLIAGTERTIQASVGVTIARYPDGVSSGDERELIHQADLAMYEAKRLGNHTWQLAQDGQHAEPDRSALGSVQ
jgi:diguanylate cyclase